MVNRILIRLKVVQMLYAYLLTRTEFKIETNPDLSSSDKKFAFSAYINLLALLLHMTGQYPNISKSQIHKKLADSALAKTLFSDSELKKLILKTAVTQHDIVKTAEALRAAVTESSAFKEYSRKRKITLEDEINLWKILFRTTIISHPELTSFLKNIEGYSTVGRQMALDKLMSTFDSYFDARNGYMTALKNLQRSLDQSYKLYLSIFVLIVRLTQTRAEQLETAKNKYLATDEDKNPNTRFIDNEFAAKLADSAELQDYIKNYAIDWVDDPSMLNALLDTIIESKVYQDYMNAPSTDWQTDCEFWRMLLRTVVFHSDEFADAIEADSVYWNDDLHIVGTFVLKSIRIDAQNYDKKPEFLPQFKDEEDSRFGAELFSDVVKNRDEYYKYIERFIDTRNWESDRIAFMDVIIVLCAISEIINFANIPLAVSFNEYIEIANLYSSTKSGQFINGILYNICGALREEGVIFKDTDVKQ